jgi:Arc/MetJ family transcription regulator
MATKRTSLLLDTELMTEAAEALGTARPTDTVRAALEQAVRHAHVSNLVAWELPDAATQRLADQRVPRSLEV